MWLRMFGAAGLLAAGCAATWWASDTWAQAPEDEDGPRAEERRPDRPPRPRGDHELEEGEREEGEREDGERGRRRGPGGDLPPPHPPRPNKLIRTLDSDHDGVISESEIKEAVSALQKLDKNGDGQLTPDEFELPPPPRPSRDGDFRRRPGPR